MLCTIMVGPWKLASEIGLHHGRHHAWAMDALDVIMLGPWMLSCRYWCRHCQDCQGSASRAQKPPHSNGVLNHVES